MLNLYVRMALDWPDLTWCPKAEIKELSPLERRFFRSIQIYEKYFWQEAFFDQSELKSVLQGRLPIPGLMSQEMIDRMVKFIQMKYTRRNKVRKPREKKMKKILLASMLISMMFGLSACSGAFWTGLGGGTLATGAGYEINAKAKMDQLKKDLDSGKINKAEYDIRVDQIKKMSVAY